MAWGVTTVRGGSEVALRGISIAAAFGSLVVVGMIAARLCQRYVTALYSCGFLLGCDVFQVGSTTARPYALATLFALVSIHATLGLRKSYAHRCALVCSFATILTWYTHYLFIVVSLGNVITIALTPGGLREMCRWIFVVIAACVPGAAHFLELRDRPAGLLFTALPTVPSILSDSMSVPLRVAALLGALVSYIWDAKPQLDSCSRETLRVVVPYIIVPPGIFVLLAVFGGKAVWLPYYWEWQVAM